MLKEVADSANVSDSGSMLSSSTLANSPPIRDPAESLRRKLFKKRLGIPSPRSAPQLTPSTRGRAIEVLAIGEVRPPPTVSSIAPAQPKTPITVEGGVKARVISKTSTPPVRRRLLSDLAKERPASVYGMPAVPLGEDLKDSLSVDDVRLEKARIVTEYLAGDEGLHLLHENKDMAGSVSKSTSDTRA